MKLKNKDNYTSYYIVEGEGGRFGLCLCKECGAAIILDEDQAKEIHDKWHKDYKSPKKKKNE